MARTLAGEGTVRCETPGGPLVLSAHGSRWRLEVTDRAAALALWRLLAALPFGRHRLRRRLGAALDAVGLRLEVQRGGRTLAVLGAGARPRWWSRPWVGRAAEVSGRELWRLLLARPA